MRKTLGRAHEKSRPYSFSTRTPAFSYLSVPRKSSSWVIDLVKYLVSRIVYFHAVYRIFYKVHDFHLFMKVMKLNSLMKYTRKKSMGAAAILRLTKRNNAVEQP